MEPIKIYGRHGNVNAARGINQDTQNHIGLEPTSLYAEHIFIISQLRGKSNNELLEIAFSTLSNSAYGFDIAEHFGKKYGGHKKICY